MFEPILLTWEKSLWWHKAFSYFFLNYLIIAILNTRINLSTVVMVQSVKPISKIIFTCKKETSTYNILDTKTNQHKIEKSVDATFSNDLIKRNIWKLKISLSERILKVKRKKSFTNSSRNKLLTPSQTSRF